MSHALAEKPYKGIGMEGPIARWYATQTVRSMDEFKALARRVAAQLAAGSRVLEVAPGPGYFAIELAKLGDYLVTGLDISHTFVEIARRNAAQAEVHVDFEQGNASKMPFPDETFDFLLCRAAFKNFSAPIGALQEMHRVLKPGGQAIIIDLKKDASNESISEAISAMGLGPVNRLVTKFTFRFMLLKRAYTRRRFEEFVAQTSFASAEIQESPLGLELNLRRPLP